MVCRDSVVLRDSFSVAPERMRAAQRLKNSPSVEKLDTLEIQRPDRNMAIRICD